MRVFAVPGGETNIHDSFEIKVTSIASICMSLPTNFEAKISLSLISFSNPFTLEQPWKFSKHYECFYEENYFKVK